MFILRLFLVNLFIIHGINGLSDANLKLKLLHVLFRHGEKVPHKEYQNYPTDPHKNYTYPYNDSGDLTNMGKLREYTIGTVLREKYDEFFGPYYWPSLIFARSTDIPRAQMSLQLVLAGLFPPSKKQIWNSNLPWLPVSVFSVPNEHDNLLFPNQCPQYIKIYEEFLTRPNIKKTISKYKDVMEYISKHSGKLVETTSAVTYLYNLFNEQIAQNLTLPEWTKKVYPNPMREITILDFDLRSYTNQLKRYNGGMLLHEVTDNIKQLRDGTLSPPNRKAFIYSAHEFNVAAMSRTLGLDKPVLPNYGSTIIIETHQDEVKRFYIRIVLWTGVTEELITQHIPGCSELCPLEKFFAILNNVIPSAEEVDQCSYELMYEDKYHAIKTNVKQREFSNSTSTSFNISTLLFLIFINFILLIAYCIHQV